MTAVQTEVYQPLPAVIERVVVENSQIKTFVLRFRDMSYNGNFTYRPGQFMMVSIPHHGEAPISFSSTPTRPGTIELSVRKAGQLTSALHELKAGAVIGLRGPYGQSFPMDHLAGRDLLFIAGGIGLAPLRSVINAAIDGGDSFGRKLILYGSRLPSDIAFHADLRGWDDLADVRCLLTVDAPEPGWDGKVGVVTTLLDQVDMDPGRTIALLCGPPLMIRFVLAALTAKGFADEDIITTMERHMKCGIGICRHCHMDGRLVCVDGPVFSLAELRDFAPEECLA